MGSYFNHKIFLTGLILVGFERGLFDFKAGLNKKIVIGVIFKVGLRALTISDWVLILKKREIKYNIVGGKVLSIYHDSIKKL